MERGRILIVGQTKENTYEIRNLLDNRLYELEIALSQDVGKMILGQRKMHLLILHTEVVDAQVRELVEYLDEHELMLPILLLGEEATRLRETLPEHLQISCFEKPYAVDAVLTTIRSL